MSWDYSSSTSKSDKRTLYKEHHNFQSVSLTMQLLIYFIFLTLIYGIFAINQVENNKSYKIRKGIRAVLNATETKHARSTEECTVQCASKEGCTRANFRGNSTCELQNYESAPGSEIELRPENDSSYLCELLKLFLNLYTISLWWSAYINFKKSVLFVFSVLDWSLVNFSITKIENKLILSMKFGNTCYALVYTKP